ncbi:Fur family transcriptional regulator [Vagococcus xieshaowenii]|uniref:Transcriptional repressor n=1 Tax=Vagococcus xieshaowenii TaxID=2562451 RepID=A0AAJ5EGR6_9ENTE|nr:Fur family transcriptional regulator [Vagococcus xieshaowenii]QCA28291.1 transcriptional repressor [Vagococcus xieshaowenii]TFZ42321.1 transcriptional repressor [Vagococcus xieshaowenii]
MKEKKIEKALEIMKKAGFKYTERRQAMLVFLETQNKYLSAKDVYEYMNDGYEGISYDTIYRNLKDFTDLHILEETEFEGEKRFRFHCNPDGHHHHHHHFICTSCGATQAIDMCPMDFFKEQLVGAQIQGHRFEIFGKCAECTNKLQDIQ